MTRFFSRRGLAAGAIAIAGVAAVAPFAWAEPVINECESGAQTCVYVNQHYGGGGSGYRGPSNDAIVEVTNPRTGVQLSQHRYGGYGSSNQVIVREDSQYVVRAWQSQPYNEPTTTHVTAPGVTYTQSTGYAYPCRDEVTVAGHTRSRDCVVELPLAPMVPPLALPPAPVP